MAHSRWPLAPLPLALALAGCSPAIRSAPEGVPVAADGRRVIDARAIEHSGARTVWDALRRTVPFFSFRENSRGRPTRADHRGRSSIALRDQPLILVDGVELQDFTVLGAMPASDVLEIEVLGARADTPRHGPIPSRASTSSSGTSRGTPSSAAGTSRSMRGA